MNGKHSSDFIQTPRDQWVVQLDQLARPVLTAMANQKLKALMPVEGSIKRKGCTYLEAIGRLLAGMSPWLEAETAGAERNLQQEYIALAQQSIDAATDPNSADYCGFGDELQTLVDTAFLAHAIIRSPNVLWSQLDQRIQQNIVSALKKTRILRPGYNNWLLFSAMIETALHQMGEQADVMRIDYALKQHELWYKGDGTYGDGPHYVWNYYNSYVIQPMLIDITLTLGQDLYPEEGIEMQQRVLARAVRYAEVQERLIAPDGTFPVIGRSMAYRCGAFQTIAQIALMKKLPTSVSPAQIRCALQAVIQRCLNAEGTFDENGWLRVGLAGSQPDLGEGYISTGSLYLCSTAFLPLGLSPADEFWTAPDQAWTSKKVWGGENIKADRAVHHYS